MSNRPRTIQIFLPGGDPQGIRVAEITTAIVKVIEVPRSMLGEFLKMDESGQVALYFLFGGADEDADERVYIGQSGDLRNRLNEHNAKKDFWERALVLISKTNSLTQTHTLFLEWHCLQEARKAERYANENGNSGSRPHTPKPLEADCYEIFENGKTLLATLGFPMFSSVSEVVSASEREEYSCTSAGTQGRGIYTPEGFVVLKGSSGRRESSPGIVGESNGRFREKLIENGVMAVEGDTIVFTKDHLFNSPSMAAVALLGRSANGWLEWETKDGRTLHDIERA
jgi:hypothetical protein